MKHKKRVQVRFFIQGTKKGGARSQWIPLESSFSLTWLDWQACRALYFFYLYKKLKNWKKLSQRFARKNFKVLFSRKFQMKKETEKYLFAYKITETCPSSSKVATRVSPLEYFSLILFTSHGTIAWMYLETDLKLSS